MRFALLLAAALSSGFCQPQPGPPPGPAPLDGSVTACSASCSKYRELGCEEGKPTAKGHTCEEVCNNAAESGIDLGGPADCIAAAKDCASVEKCAP